MNTPLVSVIIPAHNRTSTLPRAVASVIAQTYTNWEIVIVDDGSTDDTPALLASLTSSDPRIRQYRTEHLGAPHARNYGARMAHGEYISLLDSDDAYEPDRIRIQLEEMQVHDCDFSISNRIIKKSGGEVSVTMKSHFISTRELLNGSIGLSASLFLIKRPKMLEMLFDEALPSGQDLDFLLRAIRITPIWLVGSPVTVIYKSLGYARISTNYEAKTRGYELVLGKVRSGAYGLSDTDRVYAEHSLERSIRKFKRMSRLNHMPGIKVLISTLVRFWWHLSA